MKRNRIALVLALALVVGCPGVPPQTVAYRAIGSVAVTVDNAMKGWADYVHTMGRCAPIAPTPNCVTVAAENSVRSAFNAYKKGENAAHKAIDAYRAATTAPTGTPGVPNTSAMESAIAAVSAAASDLVGAISQQKGGKP